MSAGREASGTTRLYQLIDDWCSERKATLSEFARQAGVDRQTLYNLNNGRSSNMRTATKQGIERVFGWAEGGVDDFLAGREPTPRIAAPRGDGRWLELKPVDVAPTFAVALEAYRQALQQLRSVATTDPDVPPGAVDIIADWEMMLTALMFGGVTAVRRAIADSYRRALPDEGASDQAG